MNSDGREKILETNTRQADFYNATNDIRIANLPMATWRFVRRRMYRLMDATTMRRDTDALHLRWMGDLSGKKVLDFGCYEGNRLSLRLARESADYLGVDLSDKALAKLARSFKDNGIQGARVRCVDILSPDFDEGGFDVIYAHGVLHHFNPIEALLPVLHEKLAPGGIVVSFDPLQTSFLTRSVRAVYHPFRSDRDWEWPFRRATLQTIGRFFDIVEVQGFLGASKWAIPLVFVAPDTATRVAQGLHQRDLRLANRLGGRTWGCLQLAMYLRKRNSESAGG